MLAVHARGDARGTRSEDAKAPRASVSLPQATLAHMPQTKQLAELNALEKLIEAALRPDELIAAAGLGAFIAGVAAVAAQVAKLHESRPDAAAPLWEALLVGCIARAPDVPITEHNLRRLARDCLCSWIDARQQAGADPQRSAQAIYRWLVQDRGSLAIESTIVRIASALRPAELQALDVVIRQAMGPAGPHGTPWRPRGDPWVHTARCAMLKAVAAARNDAPAFEALIEPGVPSLDDCETLANVCGRVKQFDAALGWVEHGLKIAPFRVEGPEGQAERLRALRRDLLVAANRREAAIRIAWREFDETPSATGLDVVLNLLPASERPAAEERALVRARTTQLEGCMSLCVKLGALDLLAERVLAAEDCTFSVAFGLRVEVAAANALRKPHPAAAARLYAASALGLIAVGSMQHCDMGLEHVRAAKACYWRSRDTMGWQRLVNAIRWQHPTAYRAHLGLDRILRSRAGQTPPSFLQLAKARWGLLRE